MTHPIFIDTSLYDVRRPDPLHPGQYLYDRPVDWSQQAAAGARLAFIKSSEYKTDPGFLMQWAMARKAGLILGAYHFFRPSLNAIKQAQDYIELVNVAGLAWTGDALTSDKLILDLEAADGMPGPEVLKAAASWVYEVRKAFPLNEISIYTGVYFWKTVGGTGQTGAWAKDYNLWLAVYPLDPHGNWQPAPFGWAEVRQIATDILAGQYPAPKLLPWDAPTYRQFTAWAMASEVPGHAAVKKVVDVNVSMIEFPETGLPVHETQPPENAEETEPVYRKVQVIAPHNPRIRSGPGKNFLDLGLVMRDTILYIDAGPTNSYVHFVNFGATPNPLLPPGGWIYASFTKPVS
jgi:hypothetical protein